MQIPKILIVDDELAHLETIVDIIEEAGKEYRVFQAFEGKTALKIAEKEIPDLIITDWEMPEMSGIDLIKRLKDNALTRDIPVIMCTGAMTTSENLKIALEAGAIDYVRKPVDAIELIARTRSVLKITEYQKEMIEQKNRELTENSMYLVQYNQFNIKLITEVGNTIEICKNNNEAVKSLSNIVSEIESKVKDDAWSRFDIYFQRGHSSFQKNLTTKYPELTNSELRLSTFLRLGMSSKDISAATYQSIASIKVSRSRLRKKLGVDSPISLTAFLSQF